MLVLEHNPKLVVHCKRSPYEVYIGRGRGSKWGNPFILDDPKDRIKVALKYYEWLLKQPDLLRDIMELDGKILGCWCSPLLCHGDVILRVIQEIKLKEIFS